MSNETVPPDGEPDTAGIEAAKQAVYETMPVVLKDLVARSEAEAAIGVPHGAGVPDRWLADVAVRAYLAAGRAAATPDPPPCRCPDDWRYDDGSVFCPRHSTKPDAPAPASPDPPNEDAIRADERERLSARVYENGWCPTCVRTVGEVVRRCKVCGAVLNTGTAHRHEDAEWKPMYDDFEGALEGYETIAMRGAANEWAP